MAIGTITSNVSGAQLVGDALLLQTAENGRVKISFTVLVFDPFERSKEPKPFLMECHHWTSRNLVPYLTDGKHVTLVGSIGRYQGPTRASVQLGCLGEFDDLELARSFRDDARTNHREAGIVSVREDNKTTYQVWSEVVDRIWIQADKLILGADSYSAIIAEKQAEIDQLTKLAGDLQAQMNEYTPATVGLTTEQAEALAKAAKGRKADMEAAIADLLATYAPATSEAPESYEAIDVPAEAVAA
ncbi:hypothetical protein [Nodosilinea nodulosa]|uniref:hypothetical protein n=1 Tax=Nodosilinea nodulosa TaxID=416001 RepID=UPI000301660B|nr:hypothetical protein [Nodosilinea nodulosa]